MSRGSHQLAVPSSDVHHPDPNVGQNANMQSHRPMIAAPRNSLDRRERGLIGLFLAVFIVKGILMAMFIPAWQGPDEPANFLAIANLASVERLEPAAVAVRSSVEASDFWRLRAWALDFDQPIYSGHEPSNTISLYNVVAIPAFGLGSLSSLEGSLMAIRVLSVCFGALTVWFVFLLARQLIIGGRSLPVLAASLVTLVPQFGFISSTVNKDSMTAALGAGALWGAVAWARSRSNVLLWTTGALVVAGILTKPSFSGLATGPALIIGTLLITLGRIRGPRKWALAVLGLVVGAGIVWQTNFPGYLSRIGRAEMEQAVRVTFRPATWWYVLPQAWGQFGWLNAPLPSILNVVLVGLTGAAAVGMAVLLVRRGRALLREDPEGAICIAGLLTAIAAMTASVMFAEVLFGTQARFWFPAIGAFAVLFPLGLAHLLPVLHRSLGVMAWFYLGVALNVLVFVRVFPDRFGVL